MSDFGRYLVYGETYGNQLIGSYTRDYPAARRLRQRLLNSGQYEKAWIGPAFTSAAEQSLEARLVTSSCLGCYDRRDDVDPDAGFLCGRCRALAERDAARTVACEMLDTTGTLVWCSEANTYVREHCGKVKRLMAEHTWLRESRW